MTRLFDDTDIIHSHTHADAIADGSRIDLQTGECAEVTRQHLGTLPVGVTPTLWRVIERAVSQPRHANDWRGVWHDILTMAQARRRVGEQLRSFDAGRVHPIDVLPVAWDFRVIITGAGPRRLFTLRATLAFGDPAGGLALVIDLPGGEQ